MSKEKFKKTKKKANRNAVEKDKCDRSAATSGQRGEKSQDTSEYLVVRRVRQTRVVGLSARQEKKRLW